MPSPHLSSCPEYPSPFMRGGSVKPALQYHDLTAFVGLPKPKSCRRVGLELEKIPVRLPDFSPIPLEGSSGLRGLLEEFVRLGWAADREEGRIVSLQHAGQKLSVEPGGQLEFSTAPAERIDDLYAQELSHLRQIEPWSRAAGIGWCGLGLHPFLTPESIPGWMKPRYDAMWRYFGGLPGSLGQWMMKTTSSVQVALDFDDTQDLALKLNVMARLTPVLTALFANSPIRLGQPSGYLSYRTHIWRHTDPTRCGLPACFFDWDFTPEDYIRFALDAPMIFVARDGQCLSPGTNLSFRRFMAEGWSGATAREEDWETHLSTLFPDIRLRHYLEFRCFDRQQGLSTYAGPCILKALLYVPEALAEWATRLRNITHPDYAAGMDAAAKQGLQGQYAGREISDWAKQILASTLQAARSNPNFTPFEIDRISELADRIRINPITPAQELLNHYHTATSPQDWLATTLLSL